MAEPAVQPHPALQQLIPAGARSAQDRRAGVVTRTCVMVIDALVVAGILATGYVAVGVLDLMIGPPEATFPWPVLSYLQLGLAADAVCTLYLTVCWATSGRSAGKRLFGVRVVDRRGRTPGLGLAFVRALACVTFPILLFWSAVSRQNRSVQDVVFRTSVIHDWRSHVRGAADG